MDTNNVKELLDKPVAMMTGEELVRLVSSSVEVCINTTAQQGKSYCYGMEGIAQIFGCSVPTANRIKKSGIIDDAITQIGRKIIVDAEMALKLASKKHATQSE